MDTSVVSLFHVGLFSAALSGVAVYGQSIPWNCPASEVILRGTKQDLNLGYIWSQAQDFYEMLD